MPQLATTPAWVFVILGIILMVLVIFFRSDVDQFSASLPISRGQLAKGQPVPEAVIADIISDPRNISPEAFFNSLIPESINSGLESLFIAQE